jgi:phenylacetate-CoA ligase
MITDLLDIPLAGRLAAWPRLLPRAAQWRTPAELQAGRRARLRTVLDHAARTTYYGDLFRAAGIDDPGRLQPADLARLPRLDRPTIAAHGHEAFLNADRAGLVAVQTSGSTGTPGRFYRTWREETRYSVRWMRVYEAYGCRPWDAQVNVAIADKPDRKGPIKAMRRAGMLPRVVKLGSDTPPAEVLAQIQALRPPILTGYAGAIEALAEHVLATGAEVHPPRAVFCTAMEVTERCLELAARAFGAPAVDVYVTNEFGVIAWSCPLRPDVLHLNDDALLVEVLDEAGEPVPDGVAGELVITSLELTAMPLIRYRMGDMAARVPGRCECGRGLAMMSRVQGRTAHVIRRPNGAPITTPLVTSLFGRVDAHDWVRRYQVREEPGRVLRFLIVAGRPPTESQLANLTRSIELGVGADFRPVLDFVDDIAAPPTGKRQYVVPLARGHRPEDARRAS